MQVKRHFSWLKDGRVIAFGVVCILAGFVLGMLIFGSPWHLPPAWGDIPSWISAIASLGLLIGAIITAIYAAKALGKQAEEVTILSQQNQRDSCASERRSQPC